MIRFDDYPVLKCNMSTLKETSVDDHDKKNIVYMTDSVRAAVNFDDVKREYIRGLNLSEEPKSNDALFMTDKGELVFVEFALHVNGIYSKLQRKTASHIYLPKADL